MRNILKGCNPSVFQAVHSPVRQLWGECSGVNDQLLTTTATPLITLPGPPSVSSPSLTLPPPSQDAQIILPPDICLCSSLGPTTPVLCLSLFPWPTNPFTHAISLGEMLMIAAHRKKSSGQESEESGLKIYWRLFRADSKFCCSWGDWGIQQASLKSFIYSVRQPLLHTRTFLAEIDLHLLICLLLEQLSCCWEERGWLFCDRMTWSHVKLLLVIGSFLFRHCIERGGKASLKGWIKGKKDPDLMVWLLEENMMAKNPKMERSSDGSLNVLLDKAVCHFELYPLHCTVVQERQQVKGVVAIYLKKQYYWLNN